MDRRLRELVNYAPTTLAPLRRPAHSHVVAKEGSALIRVGNADEFAQVLKTISSNNVSEAIIELNEDVELSKPFSELPVRHHRSQRR